LSDKIIPIGREFACHLYNKYYQGMTAKTTTKGNERITTKERDELPDSAFGIPETREFPLIDALHVHAAEAYFRYAPEAKKHALAKLILAKAKEYGVDVESPVVKEWADMK